MDRYFRLSEAVADAVDSRTFVVAVTNQPSDFVKLQGRVSSPWITVAIGIHPLNAANMPRHEIDTMLSLCADANCIGEIGLDFSAQSASDRAQQERIFVRIAALLSPGKLITVHCRRSAARVSQHLSAVSAPPVIFHWFSGSHSELDAILARGDYLSVNPQMMASRRTREMIGTVPIDRVVAETDGPFSRIASRSAHPSDVHTVYDALAGLWNLTDIEAVEVINTNVQRLSPLLRTPL